MSHAVTNTLILFFYVRCAILVTHIRKKLTGRAVQVFIVMINELIVLRQPRLMFKKTHFSFYTIEESISIFDTKREESEMLLCKVFSSLTHASETLSRVSENCIAA